MATIDGIKYVLSNSARSKKSQMIKKYLAEGKPLLEAEKLAIQYLKEHRYIIPPKEIRKNEISKNNMEIARKSHTKKLTEITPTPPTIPLPDVSEINEEFYSTYLLRLAKTSTPDIRIATELRNYLDKKDGIKTVKEVDDEIDFEEIKTNAEVFMKKWQASNLSSES